MLVHDSQGYKYQSITQERYAMDTLLLALDDYFGTNKVKITPSPYLYKPKPRKPKAKKANKAKPNKAKKNLLNPDEIPF